MKKRLNQPILLTIFALLTLNGCLPKTTRVLDAQGFAETVAYIGPILQDRDIVTSKNTHSEPLWPGVTHRLPEHVGEFLFCSLSSNFQGGENTSTFAQNHTKGMQKSISPFGFIAQKNFFTIKVTLLAQVDWHSRRSKDWLLHCRVQNAFNTSFVDYYLIVTPTKLEDGILKPELIALRDSASKTCTILAEFTKAANKENPFSNLSFIEVDPGFFSIVGNAKKIKTTEEKKSFSEKALQE